VSTRDVCFAVLSDGRKLKNTSSRATIDSTMEKLRSPLLVSLVMACLTLDSATHAFKYNSIAKYYSAYRRRCVEKSLESREASADAVFTGTIRDLIPDRRNPDTKV